jgi:hypothetical protein
MTTSNAENKNPALPGEIKALDKLFFCGFLLHAYKLEYVSLL